MLLSSFLITSLLQNALSEVFTATEDIKDILHTEHHLVEILERYIIVEQQKIDLIQKYVNIHQKDYVEASKDSDSYAGNPLKAFVLIKRMITEWPILERLIKINTTEAFVKNISTTKENFKFPLEEDLEGTAIAITTIQQTYNLTTSSIANGKLGNTQYNLKLSAASCFDISRRNNRNKNLYYAFSWMKEAHKKIKTDENSSVGKSEILEYLAYFEYAQNNFKRAGKYLNELLKIDPSHPKAFDNKLLVKDRLEENDDSNNKLKPFKPNTNQLTEISNQVCRGELTNALKYSSKLKCYYANNNNPFLRIAPFRLEEIYDNPKLVVYHNVISNATTEVIKNLTKSKLERADTVDKSGEHKKVNYRISKSAWLTDKESEHVDKLSKRIHHMTGLSMESAENLQVVNYGIGGHYRAHFDFALAKDVRTPGEIKYGERLATVLFYLSDVKQGGYTAFPSINVLIKPKKGSALFWYNLNSNGESDFNTLHVACPVIVGSKWVANKWIHERGQEFLKPYNSKQ
ncbi:hypothetical protein ILUMI_06507 [Ignelater luminosus]|uniref:procollagen-proline 4-dioxygenase n=1 Tax=Ignelater luminosus TaxID=2038154 RepID=A0A8K0GFA5_IGNLU|nr:hypothetical protein ILUMI_06507 [Ignelater luminosus]